ncbi:hypothetical protein NZ698_03745 [Chryseobacterium sp. PBS4-4]|uniref:Transmembrane protein n=1 Tax=Chryseobacterium edaphi TaxID=2976532 RepID=A0ABT2W247_9FLAO|nr:DUF6766 family protein [Chryseobacterium edaphi]MCU7616297.1 hypothetical protein [Chryseobacterium edaphi]
MKSLKSREKNNFFYRNGLSIVVLSLFILFLFFQFITGWHVKNSELAEVKMPPLSLYQYFCSPHFMQATFENWESEFLQMGMYVLLTISLRQKGSAESKSLNEEEDVDQEPTAHKNAPWPVKKGGIVLSIYKHSLSISFLILFLLSFIFHFIGSFNNYNEEQIEKHLQTLKWNDYILDSQFWFESFQNWQSEFLAVASIVLLSIWFREKGSPQSKPVDAAHDDN